MGKNWYLEKKGEGWYRKAKREGYRARSAFKLQQIQDRHTVIKTGDTVVDLGAAPGGWSQVAVELAGPTGRVVGVDLQSIHPLAGAQFVQGDFTKEETVQALLRLLTNDPRGTRINLVLSDMSPNLTGSYTMDQANSIWLCEHAFRFAQRVLDVGGRLVLKVFEGEDFVPFREELKKSFKNVKPFNPPASRKQSSEIYMVCTGFIPGPGRAVPTLRATQPASPKSSIPEDQSGSE